DVEFLPDHVEDGHDVLLAALAYFIRNAQRGRNGACGSACTRRTTRTARTCAGARRRAPCSARSRAGSGSGCTAGAHAASRRTTGTAGPAWWPTSTWTAHADTTTRSTGAARHGRRGAIPAGGVVSHRP